MNIHPPPNIHPSDRLRTPEGELVDIDREMAPLITELWARGLATTASCQDFGEGTEGLRNLEQHQPVYGGDAFIAYWLGYAWLKMPLDDARTLLNTLLDTPFHNHLTNRWQPGSWRLHVPLIYEDGNGVDLAPAAQIHFPRWQITELAETLTDANRTTPRSAQQ